MYNYRNCNKEVNSDNRKRNTKKYCDVSCRKMEQTYRKRDEKSFNEKKQNIKNILEEYKNVNQQLNNINESIDIIELYKKIYNS